MRDGQARRYVDLGEAHSEPLAEQVRDAIIHTTLPVLLVGSCARRRYQVARAIHDRSRRGPQQWVPVCCRGADTDTLASAFARAEAGTVYMDDVGDLTYATQSWLADRFDVAGCPATAHVRLISGATERLWQDVAAKRFLDRLYYRLNVLRIQLE